MHADHLDFFTFDVIVAPLGCGTPRNIPSQAWKLRTPVRQR
jgi:hypothetical protein